MLYKNKNILHFLLRIPETLNSNEIIFIKKFYNNKSLNSIKKILLKENIIPFASHIFIHLGLDENYWKNEIDYYSKRNELIKNSIESIFKKSKTFNINSLILTENFASLLLSEFPISCFTSGDVDLSADIKEKEKIISCMESNGFYISKRNKSANIREDQCTMFFNKSIIDSGFWINVIWVTVTRSYLNQKKFNKRLSLKRPTANIITNTNIRVLDSTSLLYFCIIHIAAGHYYTLSPGEKLYVDIDRLIYNCQIDWDIILKWAKEDNSETRISVVLYLCNKILNTRIPKIILNKFSHTNIELKSYLLNSKLMIFQKNGGVINRLYVELASGNMFSKQISKIIRIFI